MDNGALYSGIREACGDVSESCEAVVVGSGPTGAVAAYNLAAAGIDTILLEAGPVRRPADFKRDAGRSLAETCFDGGLRVLRGNAIIPTIQARVLGGGSHINSAICARTPAFCFDEWRGRYGVQSIDRAGLDPHYDRVERFFGVRPTEETSLGRRNLLFKLACDALGYSSEPTPRNVTGCAGCAECLTGCPTRAKKSADITYIPEAVKLGLRVYTSVEVRQVLHERGRAVGVAGVVVEPYTNRPVHKALVRAKVMVLAAGCLATPVILLKSGAPDPAGLIGKDLQAHPGCAIMGIFPEPVNPWDGATQGYHSMHFIEKGFKIEVLWGSPAMLAVRFPDFGARFKQHLASFRYGATWDVFFAFNSSKGRVRPRAASGNNPDVTYRIATEDMKLVRNGLATLAEMFFAAGAKKILPGVHGLPNEMTSPKDVEKILAADLKPTDMIMAATHLFGTTRMGPDPRSSVVDEDGKLHHLDGCYVVDTGVMPQSPAVNPMLTGMAISDKLSLGIARRLR